MSAPMPPDQLLSVSEVAEAFGWTPSHTTRERIRALIRAGKLYAEDHGAGSIPRWYVRESELRRYRASRRSAGSFVAGPSFGDSK